ncbi:MAG: multicopper oxidase domain-containing protein [Actinomycetota bacterium]
MGSPAEQVPADGSRRGFLRGVGAATAAVALGGLAACGDGFDGDDGGGDDGGRNRAANLSPAEAMAVRNPLPIPPLITDEGDGIALVAAASTTEFFAGSPTETWGFNGAFLGPTIRVREGQSVPITVTNELDEVITSHWHGLHIPGDIDGGPYNLIAPGETWELTMDIAQQASTSWYHSHVHEATGRQVYLGLAGVFLIDDDGSDALDLPSDYGVDDIPVILQDRTFLADGTFNTDLSGRDLVYLGETMLVNGAVNPVVELAPKRNRLRFVNGSNGRRYDLFLSDGAPLTKIATDGGLLNAPVVVDSVPVAPGERAEVIVDLTGYGDGDELTLVSRNLERTGLMADEYTVLTIRVTGDEDDNPVLPEVLNDVPTAAALLASVDVAAERTFTLRQNSQINGEVFDHTFLNHVSELGTWEVWTVNGGLHPFHIHGCSYLVLSENGEEPAPEDAGWRDTAMVGRDDQLRLLVQFNHEAAPETAFMYHCHFMGHEDAGMMGQFAVAVDPDEIDLAAPIPDPPLLARIKATGGEASPFFCDVPGYTL